MNDLQKEAAFFKLIADSVINYVRNYDKLMTITEDKGVGDYATQIDVDVEKLIVTEIQKQFVGDVILAEEGFADISFTNDRMWIIDPICGTNNLGKGINNYCTNLALAINGQIVAACVIDHSQGEYFWSIGDMTVYTSDQPSQPPEPRFGTKIDVDFGSLRSVDIALRQKHSNFIFKLLNETPHDMISLNTSLSFAYTAAGKTDGFINMFNHPWDIAAAAFLIQQSGGVISALDGTPWTLSTIGAIGARSPAVHEQLYSLYLDS